jgi:hypothetical protein
VAFIGMFAIHCARSSNPLIDPALLAVRAFSGASAVMFFFSAAFGGMLLSSSSDGSPPASVRARS